MVTARVDTAIPKVTHRVVELLDPSFGRWPATEEGNELDTETKDVSWSSQWPNCEEMLYCNPSARD